MFDDDAPVGRLLSRREALALLGAGGAAWLASGVLDPLRAFTATPAPASAPACIIRPRQTAGPYFVDDARLERSDVRADLAAGASARPRPGVPLALTFLVSRLDGASCRPLPGAQVDLWQCDAGGVYSDVRDPRGDTRGQKFLRGYQTTDAGGAARFVTIYPGWYPGRTVHIHFMIRTEPAARRGHELTSQLYFDDALTDRVHARPPYAAHGATRTRNRDDGIFRRGGEQLLLAPVRSGEGYEATFAVGLDLS